MNNTEIIRYLKNPGLLTEATLPVLEQLVKDYPWFQTGWMLYLKNLYNLNHPAFGEVMKKAAIRSGNRMELKKFIKKQSGEESMQYLSENLYFLSKTDKGFEGESNDAPEITKNTRQLIDHFLAEETGFKPHHKGKTDDIFPDHSEKSIAESEEILTETFANLLFLQGNFEKALFVYEKLSLKYPEKSITFAARIQEIKDLLTKKNI